MKWDKPMTDQTSLRNLLQKPCFACRYAAREKGRGKGRKKREGEKGRNECVPSYDSSVQGHTKKEGLPAMAKPSRDTQARKGKREREREKEKRKRRRKRREEGRGDRCSQLRASVQGHTRERGVLECYIQEREARHT